MPAQVSVVAGAPCAGKTQRLLAAYRQFLELGPPGGALWLAPTHRAVLAIRQRLLEGGLAGCLAPQCLTFEQFARLVVEASPLPVRSIGLGVQRQLVEQIIAQSLADGTLSYFRPIAETRGFVDLVVGFIQETKRLEIWPEQLAVALGSKGSPKDRELVSFYQRYQELLTAHHLYDSQGRFWSARALLLAGQHRPFAALQHVLVDGFTNFTRTEHEILALLAERIDSLSISLPLEVDSPRKELYRKSAQTLAELRARHPGLTVEELAVASKARWPAMDHVRRYLFAATRDVPPAPDTRGLEIVAASGAASEIEHLGRRIKSLLVHGDPASGARVLPSDILVVFRSLADVGELVHEVLSEFGIPLLVESKSRLESAPVMRGLLHWLLVDLEDWPYRRLLSVLGHNCFRPAWKEWRGGRAASATEQVVRWLQMPSGREALLNRVQGLAARIPEAATDADEPRQREQVLRLAGEARDLLQRMAAALDKLPPRATLVEWRTALDRFARDVGLLPRETPPSDEQSQADQTDWEQLRSALADRARLEVWLGRPPAQLSRPELCELLQDLSQVEPRPQRQDETGCVRVLSAESVRNLSAPYVFVAGLSEQSFPPPQREDCLFSQAETAELIARGLPLVPHSDRSCFEMLLFHEVLSRATRQLVLSYPAVDAKAQPLSPSPYVYELARACGGTPIAQTVTDDLSGVPVGEALSPRDLRVQAVARGMAGDGDDLLRLRQQALTAPSAESLLAGLKVSLSRDHGRSFGNFEGIFTSPEALRLLADRFGPQRIWSPSQLEQYASCPFQFFLQRVLHLEAAEEASLAIDHALRGRLLHDLLALMHRELNQQQQAHTSPMQFERQEILDLVTRLVQDLLAGLQHDRPLDDALRQIDASHVAQWLTEYYEQHQKYDAGLDHLDQPPRPAHFEVPFGPQRGRRDPEADGENDEDPLASSEPLELTCDDEVVRFSGRIDRIDIGRHNGQTVFNIIDYKSGRSAQKAGKAIFEGMAFQLPLYALAAERLLAQRGAIPLQAAYWHVATKKGCEAAIDFHQDDEGSLRLNPEWEALDRALRQRIAALINALRRGEFPMHSADPQCTSRCDFRTVCRVNHARSLEKVWQATVKEQE